MAQWLGYLPHLSLAVVPRVPGPPPFSVLGWAAPALVYLGAILSPHRLNVFAWIVALLPLGNGLPSIPARVRLPLLWGVARCLGLVPGWGLGVPQAAQKSSQGWGLGAPQATQMYLLQAWNCRLGCWPTSMETPAGPWAWLPGWHPPPCSGPHLLWAVQRASCFHLPQQLHLPALSVLRFC